MVMLGFIENKQFIIHLVTIRFTQKRNKNSPKCRSMMKNRLKGKIYQIVGFYFYFESNYFWEVTFT